MIQATAFVTGSTTCFYKAGEAYKMILLLAEAQGMHGAMGMHS